ncbi:MAG: Cna B-type domain-containing protein, partial [Clostridia bacterium]|nr:Cna B-type domain-containing protein [Clostridia bacterium]
EMKTMAAPKEAPLEVEVQTVEELPEEKKLPELDLTSFDCDFIWGEDCDCEGGPARWSGIEKILGMHIRFLPKHEVQCITVEKIWQDGGSRYRPCAVMVDLYANGIKVAVLPIMSNGTDHWKIKILVPKTVLGKEISYTVKEVAHPDLMHYSTTISGLKITNTLLRDIEVEKLWKEDHESVRPDSVSYWLMRGDAPVGGERTLSSADGWKDVIYDVPAYDEYGEIDYSIKEAAVAGYDTEVTEECLTMEAADKQCGCEDPCPDFTIINTFTNEKEITLMKKWVDDDPEDRPEELTFILDKSDGTFLEIPVTSVMGWEKEVTVEMVDENWVPFDYAVDEKEVPEGYEKFIEGFTITNSRMDEETILIQGEKTWMDDGTGRPEFIMVNLLADGVVLSTMKVMPDEEGNWYYDFGKLPMYDEEMEEIDYTVSEEAVEGYEMVPSEGYN